MNAPAIIMPEVGYHNSDMDRTLNRLDKSMSYRDLSTIIVCPTRGSIPARIVQSWMSLMRPMNQKVIGPIFAVHMEVAEAYNLTIQSILSNPGLSDWKYILTIEEDNAPPMDGLLKIYEGMDRFDVIGGLYWTKGEGGQPMIYGAPSTLPKNFIPCRPQTDALQACNGLGMGFTLFKLDIFKKMPYPWFRTLQEVIPGVGARAYTQDLYFFEQAARYGYKFASDNRVKVGHLDTTTGVMW